MVGRRTDVSLEVIERGPYTTLIRLRQGRKERWDLNPGFTVRLYHDARCAEVVEYQRARHFKPYIPTRTTPCASATRRRR